MLTVAQLQKLVEEWYRTVPKEMRNQVIASSFDIKPITFTPNEVLRKVQAAAKQSKTRASFIKAAGVCGEFMETLERIHARRSRLDKGKGGKRK